MNVGQLIGTCLPAVSKTTATSCTALPVTTLPSPLERKSAVDVATANAAPGEDDSKTVISGFRFRRGFTATTLVTAVRTLPTFWGSSIANRINGASQRETAGQRLLNLRGPDPCNPVGCRAATKRRAPPPEWDHIRHPINGGRACAT